MGVPGNYLMTAENPTVSDLRDERQWQPLGFSSNLTSSGVRINPANALTVSAYYDGIRIISEDIAKLPFPTFRKMDRGREEAPEHPVYPLLKRSPNENMSAMSFRETMTAHAISWGGGFALIERDGRGTPLRLDIVHPSRVKTEIDRQGRTFYEVGLNRDRTSIETIIVLQAGMFHLHGLSEDGINGYSVASLGAESLGRAISQEQFSASFFRSGSSPKGALRFAKKFRDQEELERLRTQWQETYSGIDGWHKPIILEQGAEWQQITIPPEDAQMIESQNFSVTDIARWLRIAPHKLGLLDNATFSNIEEQNIDHINDTLLPWMSRWEEECTRKLFIGEEDVFFARHDTKELLRGNSEARSAFLREMFNIGAMSQNEVRQENGMNPIDDGDTYYVQGQLIRSEDASAGSTNATDGPPAGRLDGNANEPRQRALLQGESLAAKNMILNALKRCDAKEKLAITNAKKKHGDGSDEFYVWMRKFQVKHRDYIFDSVQPVITGMADLFGIKTANISGIVSQFATHYAEPELAVRREIKREQLIDTLLHTIEWRKIR